MGKGKEESQCWCVAAQPETGLIITLGLLSPMYCFSPMWVWPESTRLREDVETNMKSSSSLLSPSSTPVLTLCTSHCRMWCSFHSISGKYFWHIFWEDEKLHDAPAVLFVTRQGRDNQQQIVVRLTLAVNCSRMLKIKRACWEVKVKAVMQQGFFGNTMEFTATDV